DRSPLTWARRNLFSSAFNSVLTVLMGALVAWAVWRAVTFVFVTAEWEIVRRNLTLFMVGRFPRDQLWRMWASITVLAVTLGLVGGMLATTAREVAVQLGRPAARRGIVPLLQRFWPSIALVVVLLGFTRTITPTLVTLGVLAAGTVAYQVGGRVPASVRGRWWLVFLAGLVASVLVLVAGDGIGWNQWSGLHLNLFVAFAGIVLAFPLGLLLA